MRKFSVTTVFCLLPVSLCAQWLHFRQPGIPRSADGMANLAPRAPRTAGGKPRFVVSLVKDLLYLADLPLYPQTESRFETSIAAVEFAFDAGGAVTSLTLPGAAGDEFTLTRKR